MFEFKGTAAADASNKRIERDWRVTDHYNIQQLGKRPFISLQSSQTSLHQRSLTEDTKRPSLLQIRSRSNSSVAHRTIYERADSLPTFSIDHPTPRSSVDRRSVSGGSIHKRVGSSDSFGKTLMAKGSKLLRRQNSKHDLTSLQTLNWLEENSSKGHVQEMSTRPGSRHSRIQCSGDELSPRYNISEPFNFQHLTHTTPQHVQKIQSTNHNDLVSEFSAIRASQAPRRELRGIKANDIQQGIYFSEYSASETSSPPQTGYSCSITESPDWDRDQAEHQPLASTSPVRQFARNRSTENFSQPSPGYHTTHSSPTSTPLRTPTRNFAPDFFTSFHEPFNGPTDPHAADEVVAPSGYPPTTYNNGSYDLSLPHAVTTPDDTAHPIVPPPWSMVRTELSGVPEEDEFSEGKRSSIATSIIRPTTPTSSVRHAKSFPSTKLSPRRRSGPPPPSSEDDDEWLPRETSKSICFAAPCADEHRNEIPARPRASRRISLRKEDSWEDVIDYCYEHEAEADCNFDWDLASVHEQCDHLEAEGTDKFVSAARTGSEIPVTALADVIVSNNQVSMVQRRSSSSYSSSPPPLLPLQTSLPDLQHHTASSAESSFSSIPEATTPCQFEEPTMVTRTSDPNRKGWSVPATASPIVVLDNLTIDSHMDDMYRDMLTSHGTSDQQLPFHPARVDGSTIDNSPRSSRAPLSKSSSQESFWYSQANAAARRHRNVGSVGSLPELIPSKSNEKSDLGSDQLADNNASLNASDAPADGFQRRCSPNLAKNVALKSILSKAIAPAERDSLPIHPAYRDRANSDATSLNSEHSLPSSSESKRVGRMRSSSSVSDMSFRTGKRASYSLFPSPSVVKS